MQPKNAFNSVEELEADGPWWYEVLGPVRVIIVGIDCGPRPISCRFRRENSTTRSALACLSADYFNLPGIGIGAFISEASPLSYPLVCARFTFTSLTLSATPGSPRRNTKLAHGVIVGLEPSRTVIHNQPAVNTSDAALPGRSARSTGHTLTPCRRPQRPAPGRPSTNTRHRSERDRGTRGVSGGLTPGKDRTGPEDPDRRAGCGEAPGKDRSGTTEPDTHLAVCWSKRRGLRVPSTSAGLLRCLTGKERTRHPAAGPVRRSA
ncbi:hypothetical protein Bbelb_040240 [Branchiostoma belcheri]|nr:hypothetical protein Bbelb_040240 [Branchiostoma belcheri]